MALEKIEVRCSECEALLDATIPGYDLDDIPTDVLSQALFESMKACHRHPNAVPRFDFINSATPARPGSDES